MKKLLFGAVVAMIVASPASAGGCKFCPSWRSDRSSDAPPAYGKEFGAPVAGSPAPVCHLGFDVSRVVCSQPMQTPPRLGRAHESR
jgi:hypothetical protein